MNTSNNMPKHMPFPMMPVMPKNIQLARTYILDQPYDNLFPLNEALKKGTLFPNLYQPYSKNK
ncbi:spore coat associated protein CotJA [Defluviitalea phaphyphila]|uniref:spore coat associated protein CotJA n=1 Tax=Defluviitalea phaphyphila TaxID=1473580 RepID=UPI0007319B0E|nr:spore coat associated protein CotJA [Defluviitalea phaphyphila]